MGLSVDICIFLDSNADYDFLKNVILLKLNRGVCGLDGGVHSVVKMAAF